MFLDGLITDIYGNEDYVVDATNVIDIKGHRFWVQKHDWVESDLRPVQPGEEDYIRDLDFPVEIQEGEVAWLFGYEYVNALTTVSKYSALLSKKLDFIKKLPVFLGYRMWIVQDEVIIKFCKAIYDEVISLLPTLFTHTADLYEVRKVLVGFGPIREKNIKDVSIIEGVIFKTIKDTYSYDMTSVVAIKLDKLFPNNQAFDKTVVKKIEELQGDKVNG